MRKLLHCDIPVSVHFVAWRINYPGGQLYGTCALGQRFNVIISQTSIVLIDNDECNLDIMVQDFRNICIWSVFLSLRNSLSCERWKYSGNSTSRGKYVTSFTNDDNQLASVGT